MKPLWLGFLLMPQFVWAQTVTITEIAPLTLALQPEWFEFKIEGDGDIDMREWQLSNGKNTPKPLLDYSHDLQLGDGVKQTPTSLVFEIENTGFFTLQPSPISLPNNGGTVQILDESGNILAEQTYAKAKSSSTKHYEEREVWNWNETDQVLVPQLIRAPETPSYKPSLGHANLELPTSLKRFTAVINEVSVDHDKVDFIEILIKDGPDQINLQYLELKHNGTSLWYFTNPQLVKPGQRLVFKVGTPETGKAGPLTWHTNAREGLSAGSGTVELIGLSGTSQETLLDVLCWQKDNLSQTEKKRVSKYYPDQHWREHCVSIEALLPNESIARPVDANDSNTAQDWFRHFNGSMGTENQTRNQPPVAQITLQGRKNAVAEAPFSVNPTGEKSTDPDGYHDIKIFDWTLNGQKLSDKSNPSAFKVETPGEFQLKLTVTDHSGAEHSITQTLVGLKPQSRNSNNGSAQAQKLVAAALIKKAFKPDASDNSQSDSDFLNTFLAREDWQAFIIKNQEPQLPVPNYEPEPVPEVSKSKTLYETDWPRQINLPIPVRQRVKKNLGILFSWRESPWPDLAAEWNAVATNDQKFGYFEVVYRGF